MMKKIFLLLILVAKIGFAQQNKVEVAQWKFYAESTAKSDEFNLVFEVKIEKGWHTYSQQEMTDGPIPTKITISPDGHKFEPLGSTIEPKGEKKMDEAFGIEIISFEGTAKFSQLIRVNSKDSFKVAGNIEFMTCNSVQCNPPKTIPFVINIP